MVVSPDMLSVLGKMSYNALSIYLSIGINVRFAAMMADVGDGLL